MYTCEELGDEIYPLGAPIVLRVHHLYYIKRTNPWDYENKGLITLCNDYHLEVHKTETIPVYKIED